MVTHTRKNLNLLKYAGLDERRQELEKLYSEFGKISHKEAIIIWITEEQELKDFMCKYGEYVKDCKVVQR